MDQTSGPELTGNASMHANEGNLSEVRDSEFPQPVPENETRQMVSIESASLDIIDRNSEWAKTYFNNPETGVVADRYRFVELDWFSRLKHIQSSSVYLAAASGRAISQEDMSSKIDFVLPLYKDLTVALQITQLEIKESDGLERWVIRGHVVMPSAGRFNLTVRNNPNRIRGQIDTLESHIRIDTPKDASATVITEFNRERMEADKQPIDGPRSN